MNVTLTYSRIQCVAYNRKKHDPSPFPNTALKRAVLPLSVKADFYDLRDLPLRTTLRSARFFLDWTELTVLVLKGTTRIARNVTHSE